MENDPRERLPNVYNEIRETAGDAASAILAGGREDWLALILKSHDAKLVELLREASRLRRELGLE